MADSTAMSARQAQDALDAIVNFRNSAVTLAINANKALQDDQRKQAEPAFIRQSTGRRRAKGEKPLRVATAVTTSRRTKLLDSWGREPAGMLIEAKALLPEASPLVTCIDAVWDSLAEIKADMATDGATQRWAIDGKVWQRFNQAIEKLGIELRAWMKKRKAELIGEGSPIIATAPAADPDRKEAAEPIVNQSKKKRPRINGRMLETLQQTPEAYGWSITQWTVRLDCSRAAVHATETWRTLKATADVKKVNHAVSKRRKSKPVRTERN